MGEATSLSAREREVLRGIAEDKTYAQIGHALGLGYESVKVYAKRLRTKLGVNTKTGLALYYERNLKEAD